MNDKLIAFGEILISLFPIFLIISCIPFSLKLVSGRPFNKSLLEISIVDKLNEIVTWRKWIFKGSYYCYWIDLNDYLRLEYHSPQSLFDNSYFELINTRTNKIIYSNLNIGFDPYLTKENKLKIKSVIDERYPILKLKYLQSRENVNLGLNDD